MANYVKNNTKKRTIIFNIFFIEKIYHYDLHFFHYDLHFFHYDIHFFHYDIHFFHYDIHFFVLQSPIL